jgi:CXXX repeat peptide maturase
VLKDVLIWAIKNGLNIQILFPDYHLPESYQDVISQYEHVAIRHLGASNYADIYVTYSVVEIETSDNISAPIILHTSITDFISNCQDISNILPKLNRLNIVFDDIYAFTDEMSAPYENALTYIADKIIELYRQDKSVQFNLITDRIMLSEMNNCNAGIESITIAPNGQFYVCPAFYISEGKSCGNYQKGVYLANQHLYSLQYAPICRECDAFHCRRCVMLNKQLTFEINTPGHQQCVMAHVERKVSKKLLDEIRRFGTYAPNINIPQLNYNDPFDKILNQSK